MATWIIGGIVVLIIAIVAYRTFFKKNKAGCSQCEEVGCPLIDHAKMVQANNRRKA